MKLRVLFFVFLISCFSIAHAQVANPVSDLVLCDDATDGDDTNGFSQSFDFSFQTPIILGGQSSSDYTVTYHESQMDADNGNNALSSPFTNTVANTQPIFVRVTDNNTNGFATTSFNIVVNPLPIISSVAELAVCDDNIDGFAPFDLEDVRSDISSNFTNETFEFYETLSDAQNGINTIANPLSYMNQTQYSDTVWARAISAEGCFRIAQVNLIVSTASSIITNFTPRTLEECDDFLDVDGNDTANNDDTDGIASFNLDITAEILSAFPINESPFIEIKYYRNTADAMSEVNAIADPSNYRNIGFPTTQSVYVRVDNQQNNNCVGIAPLITLIVTPVPVSNPVANLELEDNDADGDAFNGIVQTFDLTSQTPIILGAQNSSDYTVTYHTSETDAWTGSNAIINTSAYENITPNLLTIYVRVMNNLTGCFTARNTFDLVVTDPSLSIDSESDIRFSLFPNPVNDETIVELPNASAEEYQVQLLDIQGKLIQQKIQAVVQNNIRMNVSQVSNGIYLVRVLSEGKSSLKKLIVNHQ